VTDLDADDPAAPAADLAADTAVEPLPGAPGRYLAELSDRWDFRTPSGGVLMTVALRAMRAELADPALRPVSATALFCSPVPAGRLEVRVEVLRRGGAAAQLRAALASTSAPGPGLEVSATFARERPGVDAIDAVFPTVPPPDQSPAFAAAAGAAAGPLRNRFFANFDSRLARGERWWVPGWQAGPARLARWFRYRVRQRDAAGRLDPLALPPVADTMPPALVMKLGPATAPFIAPSLDLTVHFLDDADTDWLLVDTWCRRARAGIASAEAEIWSADGRLIAFAAQTMMLRRISG
jgi:acyl-CoA thioesterase